MTKPCPICGKPSDAPAAAPPAAAPHRPFCSRRCAEVDLHRWLSGQYAIPAAGQDDPDEEGRDGPGAVH